MPEAAGTALTWNEMVERRRAGFELMGLRPPPAALGFSFLRTPEPKVIRCRVSVPRVVDFRGRATTRSRSIGARKLTVLEHKDMRRDVTSLVRAGVYAARPVVFGDCPPEGVPCGFVSCRHHLGVDADPDTGKIKITHPVPDAAPERAHLMRKLSPVDAELYRLFEQEGLSMSEAAERMGLPERRLYKVRDLTRRKLNASPELDILSMTETCSLRAAAAVEDEGMSEEEIGRLMGGLCGNAVGRILKVALKKVAAARRELEFD